MIVASLVLSIVLVVLMLFNVLLLSVLFVRLDPNLVPVAHRDRSEREEGSDVV